MRVRLPFLAISGCSGLTYLDLRLHSGLTTDGLRHLATLQRLYVFQADPQRSEANGHRPDLPDPLTAAEVAELAAALRALWYLACRRRSRAPR